MRIDYAYTGLYRVVSGGQTGADQAGLHVARNFRLETGGHIPKGFRTHAGSMPSLGEDFGLIEHSSTNYQPRTKLNAAEGDGTVRLASNFLSPGERLTLKYVRELKKFVYDVPLRDDMNYDMYADLLAEWIIRHGIGVLNVAGNADRSDLNGYHFRQSKVVLTKTFEILAEKGLLIQS